MLDGNDNNVLGGDVGEDNAFISMHGVVVPGEKTIATLDVGGMTLKTYAMSGQKPVTYRILRVG